MLMEAFNMHLSMGMKTACRFLGFDGYVNAISTSIGTTLCICVVAEEVLASENASGTSMIAIRAILAYTDAKYALTYHKDCNAEAVHARKTVSCNDGPAIIIIRKHAQHIC